jgi:hypothetical protein
MPIDPADYEYEDPEDSFVDIPDDYSCGFQAMSGTSMFDDKIKGHASHMSGTSLDAPYMMMVILGLRMHIQSLKEKGLSDDAIKTALYCLIRLELSGKASTPRPGTDESFQIAIDDVNNFNDVATALFNAYAKDRSLCRDGLTQILKGDNFSITLNMSSPNSQENVTGL